MRSIIILTLAAVLGNTTLVHAAYLTGRVTDAATGEPIPAASVYIGDMRIGATTDIDGVYGIPEVPPGDHTLKAYLVGYSEELTTVTIGFESVVRRNFALREAAIEVAAIEVRANRISALSVEVPPSREVFDSRELRYAPVFAEPDPIRVFKTLPGVLQLSDFSVGLYVRGGTPDQNLVLVDGTSLYNVSHLFGLFSMFPADAVESAELLKGGFPAQYGGRLSSVLKVTSHDGDRQGVSGAGGVSLISSRLTLQGPVGNGSWMLSGRRTYLEPILAVAAKFNSDIDAFGYSFYDVQGKIQQSIFDRDRLEFSFYLGDDDLAYNQPTLNAGQLWGNRAASVMWSHVVTDDFVTTYRLSGSRYRSRLRLQLEDLGAVETNRITDISGKTDVTWFASDEHRIEAGVDFVHHDMDYTFDFDENRFNSFATKSWNWSAYTQDTWLPWPFLTIQPGLRTSWFTNGDYVMWNPRLATRYQIGDDTFLKVSVGRYSQHLFRVSREIQGLSVFSDLWFTADSTAGPSHAWQYIAGMETRLGRDWDLDIEVYYKDFDRLAEFYSGIGPGEPTIGELLLRGEGEAYGVEVGVKKRAGEHTGWVSYSLGWATRTIAGINTVDPNDRNSEPLPYYPKFDQRHSLNVVYQWQFTDRWTFNSSYAFASGQPYTPLLGRYQMNDDLVTWEQTYTARTNSVRLPYYSRLDLGVRANYSGWGITWQPFVQAINVLNRKNIFNRYWTDGDAEAVPPTPGKETNFPQLPFLVTLGVDVIF